MNTKSENKGRRTLKSEKRRAQILAAAIEQIAKDGMVDFGLRRVAARAGMSLSSLQHHYPTLDTLLSALAAETIKNEHSQLENALTNLPENPTEALKSAILNLSEISWTQGRNAWLPHFWAEATRNAQVATQLDQLYAAWRAAFVALLKPLLPDLTFTQLDQVARLLTACIEGHAATVGLEVSAEASPVLAANNIARAALAFGATLTPPSGPSRFV